MPQRAVVKVGLLKSSELAEADRIVNLAFGTYLGVPNPLEFMGGRSLLVPRWGSGHVKVIAAREAERLIGSNVVTRWGSFGFFGTLSVLPEYWDRGVAQRLLAATVELFDKWGVRHSGLFTFPHSTKHVGLYQKFGYWPRYLTAVMTYAPKEGSLQADLLSGVLRAERERAIELCGKLTDEIDAGLDLSGEIRAVMSQGMGDVVLVRKSGGVLDGFAICQHGPGSEGGGKVCYLKFGAAGPGCG